MNYGIKHINKKSKNDEIVRCNNCWNYFYEEITDERNDNSLAFIWDKKTKEFFKGCPKCKTDDYLIDINRNHIAEIQIISQ